MKKTPSDFATTPTQNVMHAVIASVAIAGIANSMVIPAKAVTSDAASYDTATQKSFQGDVRNGYTYGTIQTSSRQGSGGFTYIANDDNNNYSDNN